MCRVCGMQNCFAATNLAVVHSFLRHARLLQCPSTVKPGTPPAHSLCADQVSAQRRQRPGQLRCPPRFHRTLPPRRADGAPLHFREELDRAGVAAIQAVAQNSIQDRATAEQRCGGFCWFQISCSALGMVAADGNRIRERQHRIRPNRHPALLKPSPRYTATVARKLAGYQEPQTIDGKNDVTSAA